MAMRRPHLPSSLTHRVRDHAIDPDAPEEQCHRSGNAEHHQGEGGASHGFALQARHGPNRAQWPPGKGGQHLIAYLIQEPRRSHPGTLDHVDHVPCNEEVFLATDLGPEAPQHHRPIHDVDGFLIHSIVPNIAHDPDDLTPIAGAVAR